MKFDSSIFLFLALPFLIIFYFIVGKKLRNIYLFIINLLLYSFGEPIFILLLLITITTNYGLALLIKKFSESRPKLSKAIMIIAICLNLGSLIFFKYFMFLNELVNNMLGWVGIASTKVLTIALPLGISFYTFQAISYIVDTYKNEITPTKNFIKFGLYFSFFAQITAGPIVRYKDIENQLDNRILTMDGFSYGLKRFLIGLGQKIVFANYFAKVANEIFNSPASTLGGLSAWVGILFYTLQIYFDFAGYSSMAIGIAKMFGFDFKENFNHPYMADSIKDFWRRWHISLSTWFRDYVYFPLGGNRKGKFRMYLGLFLVFTLSGVWHGASLTFIVWGIYHAIFNIIEKLPTINKLLTKTPKPIKHIYTMLIVIIGWVFFRSPTLSYAFEYLGSMLFIHGLSSGMPMISPALIIIVILGTIGTTSILTIIKEKIEKTRKKQLIYTMHICSWLTLIIVFVVCIPIILTGAATPFIYAQF